MTTTTIKLKEFYEQAEDLIIPVNSNVFLPDDWTHSIAKGVDRLKSLDLSFEKSIVLEVGVGSGINMAGILTSKCSPASYIGTDITDDSILASQKLAKKENFNVKLYQSDLLQNIPTAELKKVSHIIACIPQVPKTGNISDRDAADYYTPTGSDWDKVGLGLNQKLLKQAESLAPQASITLNLCGRPGLSLLQDFFRSNGREAKILHTQTIQQCPTTSLQSLSEEEKNNGITFEFYADAIGKRKINAQEAEKMRTNDKDVFHKIYVIHSPAIKKGTAYEL